MSSFSKVTASKSFESVEDKKTYEGVTIKPRRFESKVFQVNEVIEDLISDNESIDRGLDTVVEEDPSHYQAALEYVKEKLNEPSSVLNKDNEVNASSTLIQNDNQENANKLNSLNLTFIKTKRLNQLEVFNIAHQIKGESQNVKFVRLSFQECWRMKDDDLENIGKALGSKLGNVEYLNLSLFKLYKATVFGIHRLIRGMSGQENTIKVLRLRIREDWNLGNQSLQELIRLIRVSLVNLEELKIVVSGNLWVTNGGVNAIRDDERVIEGLGLGLKKYEVIHYWWNMVGLVKDAAGKDMSKHIMEKFSEKGLKEGTLVTNKVLVWYKWVASSKIVNNKVVLGERDILVKA